jgi:Ca-activated chloride channel homolog
VSFASPFLLATLVVPLLALVGYLWLERRPPRTAISFPNLAVLASVATRSNWRRHLIAGLLLGAVALLCVAVARPRVPIDTTSDRATVVLVVDVSYSMVATDVAPSRLEAARAAITSFANHVPSRVKIGLVSFADDSVVVTSPTTDRRVLKEGIASLGPGYGTAIGDALGRGVELTRLSTGQAETANPVAVPSSTGAIVLLSDGTQTNGLLSPDDGAGLAKEAGIPVYTIALGTLTGTVTIDRNGQEIVVPVPPDRTTLARIAESTGGSSFDVTDAEKLSSVYERLGRIVATTSKPHEVSAGFVGVAALLLTLAIGLAALSAPRLP